MSELCVSKLYVGELCVGELCVSNVWEAAGGGGGRRGREYRTKNKNPTQRCGEK